MVHKNITLKNKKTGKTVNLTKKHKTPTKRRARKNRLV